LGSWKTGSEHDSILLSPVVERRLYLSKEMCLEDVQKKCENNETCGRRKRNKKSGRGKNEVDIQMGERAENQS
jgi:hypothetical protein